MGKSSAFIFSLILCGTTYADLKTDINQLLQAAPNNIHQGIYVQSMKTKHVLFEKNQHYLFTPASILKIVPAIASLKYLGKDYQFKTDVISASPIHHGVINGDVYFKFSGDPDFRTSDLQKLIANLKHKGLKKINGHVYIDKSAYDHASYPPGRVYDDMGYYYSAPVSAISLNENNFALRIDPSNALGQKAKLTPILPTGIVTFENEVITAPHSSIIKIYASPSNHYLLQGNLNIKAKHISRKMALTEPEKLVKSVITTSFQNNQIPFIGSVKQGRVPSDKKLYTLSTHFSKPLKSLIRVMLTESNNHIADSLVKKLGQVYYQKQGTWGNGVKAMEAILAKPTGIDFKKNHITDGSGLSRYDLMTPKQFGKLLNYAYNDKQIFPVFYQALPQAGEKGSTLAWRMKGDLRSKYIHAKTGSMGGVTALVGYAQSKTGDVRSFVIITNGFVDKRKAHSKLEDQLALRLAT
ncbi:MAG: D-alanyl-D-alanine carboxypeptidase/D-alanyl-D-alanine-endopeptidase [Gammaproteobacteria bacterium RIFCSPHIGHO2_12_FULL_41_15]|nr:MAG: D-alanyl-D-alanine carboxypeptidase/D-alanyl-D-alanine-endopeptidase [Gammaproteobacteria bacterium RIFCSPHIGHO2_12_FULL_41_15]